MIHDHSTLTRRFGFGFGSKTALIETAPRVDAKEYRWNDRGGRADVKLRSVGVHHCKKYTLHGYSPQGLGGSWGGNVGASRDDFRASSVYLHLVRRGSSFESVEIRQRMRASGSGRAARVARGTKPDKKRQHIWRARSRRSSRSVVLIFWRASTRACFP